MKLSMILCTTEDYLLGDKNPEGNGLLWHVSDELKYFKERTLGQVVVFGKKTADCIPLELMKKTRDVEVLRSNMKLEDIVKKYEGSGKEIIIAGGKTIYEHVLQNYQVDKIYLSILKKHVTISEAKTPIYLDRALLADYRFSLYKEYPDFNAYVLSR